MTHIDRLDEEEFRVSRPTPHRLAGAALAVESLLVAVACLRAIVAAYTYSIYLRSTDHEFTICLIATVAITLLMPVLLAVALREAAPHAVSLRFRDRILRLASGWGRWRKHPLETGSSLVVQRRNRWLRRSHWEIGLNNGQSRTEPIPILQTADTRRARFIIAELGRIAGLPLAAWSEPFPRLGPETSRIASSPLGVTETPAQRAAREEIEKLHARFAPPVRQWGTATGLSAILTAAAALTSGFLLDRNGYYRLDPTWIITSAVGVMALCAVGWKRAVNRLAQALRGIRSPAAAGPLLELLAEGTAAPKTMICEALTDILPRLRPADGTALTDRHREELRSLLGTTAGLTEMVSSTPDYELKRSVVKALVQVGDERDIPIVEALLRHSQGRLSEESADCLAALYDRHDPNRPGQTLLRPVEAVEESVLLRPAIAGAGDQDTTTLLRPANADTADAVPEQAMRFTSRSGGSSVL